MNVEFLLPLNMKSLGFDCQKTNHPYYEYYNDGTKHRNKDYNPNFPEPKGKVLVFVNLEYGSTPFIQIEQDGGTRTVYHGVCPDQEFLESLLNNIR